MRISVDEVVSADDIALEERERRVIQGQDASVASGFGNQFDEMNNKVKIIFTIPPTDVGQTDSYRCSTQYRPLRLIPVSPVSDIGRYYHWEEIKQNALRQNELSSSKGLRFVLCLTSGVEYEVKCDQEYRSVLKIAETNDDCVDVVIEDGGDSDSDNELVDLTNSLAIGTDSEDEDKSGSDFVCLDTHEPLATEISHVSPVIQPTQPEVNEIQNLERKVTEKIVKSLVVSLNGLLRDDTTVEASAGKVAEETKPRAMSNSESQTDVTRPSNESALLHVGIVCDNCEGEIRGIRFKCSVCPDFDLCSKCEDRENVHNDAHPFLKMKKPIQRGAGDQFAYIDLDVVTGKVQKFDMSNNAFKTLSSLFQSLAPPINDGKGNPVEPQQSTSKAEAAASTVEENNPNDVNESRVYVRPRAARKCGGIAKPKRKRSSEEAAASESKVQKSSKILYLSGMFVADETIPCGTKLAPGSKFKKVWRVRNTGTKAWNSKTILKYCWGNSDLQPEGKVYEVSVPPLKPWQEGRVAVRFVAPKTPGFGFYQSHWRLHHRGQPFGQRMICTISVDPRASHTEPASENENTAENTESSKVEDASNLQREMQNIFDAFSVPPPDSITPPENVNKTPSMSGSVQSLPSNVTAPLIQAAVYSQKSPAPSLSGSESADEFVIVPMPPCFDMGAPFPSAGKGEHSEANESAESEPFVAGNGDVVSINDDKGERKTVAKVVMTVPASGSLMDCPIAEEHNVGVASPDIVGEENLSGFSCISSQPTSIGSSTPHGDLFSQGKHTATFDYTALGQDSSSSDKSFRAENVETGPACFDGQDITVQISSTNPFLDNTSNNSSEIANVIHVLPESILSAATNVVHNVSRAFFPPAGNVISVTSGNSRDIESQATGLTGNESEDPLLNSALGQLFEMGFWNREMNREILKKNNLDVSTTIEEILQLGNSGEPVPDIVSTQPRQQQANGSFIYEFD
ncbi:Next to BRCA1 protein [Halotydeus destructor]|nr:Next to BRCA1 protein [Halotydeus destructor]